MDRTASRTRFTVRLALNQVLDPQQLSRDEMLMAGTLVAVLPAIALLRLLQREFVAALSAGAVKG